MDFVCLRGLSQRGYLKFWMAAWNFGELCSPGESGAGSSQLILSALC